MVSNEIKINEMVDRIVKEFNPEKIILFGSYADNTVRPDSDVDLLIVMDRAGSKREMAIAIDMAVANIDVPKDIIVITSDELQKYKNVVGTIIYPAYHAGKLIYDRAA